MRSRDPSVNLKALRPNTGFVQDFRRKAHGIFRGSTRSDKGQRLAQRVRSILDPAFAMPMGIVADRNRLTIGGANTVWEYRKMPAVAKKAGTGGQARRLLSAAQRIHVTGDNKSK